MHSTYAKYSIMFSNIKGLLIFLVVLGHLIEATPAIINSFEGSTLNKLIYSFHMEAFVFVSGFFSKKINTNFIDNIRKYIKPYYLLLFIVATSKVLILGEPYSMLLYPLLFPYYPNHSSWYLLTLFYYRLFSKQIIASKYIFFLAIIASLIYPCIDFDYNYMSLGRTISFLPFFILGYYCNEKHIDYIKSISLKAFIPPIIIYLIVFYSINKLYHYEFFYLKYDYDYYLLSIKCGMLGKGAIIITSCILILVLLKTMPNKLSLISPLGRNSLSVYLLHLPFVYLSQKLLFFSTPSIFSYIKMVLYCFIIIVFIIYSKNKILLIFKRGTYVWKRIFF